MSNININDLSDDSLDDEVINTPKKIPDVLQENFLQQFMQEQLKLKQQQHQQISNPTQHNINKKKLLQDKIKNLKNKRTGKN